MDAQGVEAEVSLACSINCHGLATTEAAHLHGPHFAPFYAKPHIQFYQHLHCFTACIRKFSKMAN